MSLLDIPQDLAARLKKFRFRKTQDIACEVYEIKELEEGSRKELVYLFIYNIAAISLLFKYLTCNFLTSVWSSSSTFAVVTGLT